MMRAYIPRLAVVVSLLLLGSHALTRAQLFDSIDTVIFYPAYGVQDAGTRVWKVRMRAKVQESRSIAERFSRFVRDMPRRSQEEENTFRDRMRDLVADDKSGEDVEFQFDVDATRKEYRIEKGNGRFPETNGDGIVDGAIRLADSDAQRLLAAQKSTTGWLTYHVTSRGHEGAGRLRLIGPTGLSVISDIDDTIKITEVPAGKTEVLLNTFYRDFVAAQEMSKKYRDFGDAAFPSIAALAPKIQEIIIRDVVNARVRAPNRLDGMTPLPATTIVDGGPPPDCGSRSR